MALENRAGLAHDRLAALDAIVAAHRTLEDVVRWALVHRPPLLIADVVVQDEFTHDVVLPLADVWLVYDTT